MELNFYANPIKLDIDPIKKGISIDQYTSKFIPLSENIINPEIINFLDKLNLRIVNKENPVDILYNDANTSGPIHTDRPHTDKYEEGDYVKLIWIKGYGFMKWYEVKSAADKIDIKSPSVIVYRPDQVKELHSERIYTPSLVQVGIPHHGVADELPRQALSIPICHKITNVRFTMAEAVKIFKDYIV
jgi:hypothetical protein